MVNLAGQIRHRLSPAMLSILEQAGGIASEMGCRGFAVGGMVRDLLLGIDLLDVDIAIEGDGILFARHFALQREARVRSHERFGTATITFPDALRVDVATARTEIYERPAALPKVTPGTIRDDMRRRDFTINAMAVSLMPGEFGSVLDFFHGVRDLRERRIRVLHEKSFLDDPTRIFRAVRFEARLGFHIVRTTEKLILEALSRSILSQLEDYRIATELRLILDETDPTGPLRRLEELGVVDELRNRKTPQRVLQRQIKRTTQVLSDAGG